MMSESDFRGSDDSRSKWLKSHPDVLHLKFPNGEVKKKERKKEKSKKKIKTKERP